MINNVVDFLILMFEIKNYVKNIEGVEEDTEVGFIMKHVIITLMTQYVGE